MRKFLTCFCCVVSIHVMAQDSLQTVSLDEVVVTGTRFDIKEQRSGKSIFKVNQNQLTRFPGQSVSDILNEVPGVQMDGVYGTPGTNIEYYVRGGRSKHSLILLDGIPMTDPTGINPFYDLRLVSMNQIETLEIFQGGLSTLYGSGAAASVINIQLKQPDDDGVHGDVGLSTGSWSNFGQHFNLNGKRDRLSFQTFGRNSRVNGFSAALDSTGTNSFDNDGTSNRSAFAKIGYAVNDEIKIEMFGGYDWFSSDYDIGAFTDSDEEQEQSQLRVGAKAGWNYSNGTINLTTQKTITDREYGGSYPASYKGKNVYVEGVSRHHLGDYVTLVSGTSFQKMTTQDTTHVEIMDPYTTVFIGLPKGFSIHGGLRWNIHSVYGSELLYNVNPSWLLKAGDEVQLKLYGSISSSYITPTLYQLYDPFYGNLELKPEKDVNSEVGITIYWSDNLRLNTVLFSRKEKNPIGFISAYENLDEERRVTGATSDLKVQLNSRWGVTGDFAYQQADPSGTLYRIPKYKAGVSFNVKLLSYLTLNTGYHFTGNRDDLFFYFDNEVGFASRVVNLGRIHMVDFSVNTTWLNSRLSLQLGVNNLLDDDFIGIYGFSTRGRNYNGSVSYAF